MMNIEINVFDYLTPDEIREECKAAIRNRVNEMFRRESEVERLISNLSYEFIFEAVSNAIGKDAKKVIADKVEELLGRDDAIKYEMWRKKTAWEQSESPAVKILYQAIEDNKHLIRKSVEKQIEEYEIPDIRDAMYFTADQIIREKLFGKKGDI